MGNANSTESLYEAVDCDDFDQVKAILKANPGIVNQPVSDENPTTPLARAAWRGNIEMIYTLLELGADINFVGPQQISPLQWAAQRGKDEAVDFLAQKGAKLDFVSKEKLTAIDYSILYGSYNIAWKLMNLGAEPKTVDFYKAMANEKHILYYDYEKMLEHLHRKVPLEECPPFNIAPPEPGFKDPVIDPRETWAEFAKRIMDFEEPPLVERDDLPAELRPENRFFGKLRSFINGQSPYPEDDPAVVERPDPEIQKEKQKKPGEESVVLTSEEAQKNEDDDKAAEKFEHVIDVSQTKFVSEGSDGRKGSEDVNYSTDGLVRHVELQPVKVNVGNKNSE